MGTVALLTAGRGRLADALAETLAGGTGPRCRSLGEGGEAGAGGAVLLYTAGAAPDPDHAAEAFRRARRAGIDRAVVVGSAAVYEPSYQHPGMADEERLPPPRTGNPLAAAFREVEEHARRAFAPERRERGPESRLALLRPATVPLPGAEDPVNRALAGGRIGRVTATPAGFDPPLQLLDVADLSDAVARAAEAVLRDDGATFNLAPEDALSVRRALAAAGARRLPVPATLLRSLCPAGAADYLRYPWTVSGDRARRRLGFEPRHGSAAALARAYRPDAAGRTAPVEPGDPFGLDERAIRRYQRGRFRFLHDLYWRVEEAGLEHLPREGPVVLTGLHRGFMPFDGVMALHAIVRETGRVPRFLIHPALVKFPGLAVFLTRLGGIHACRENADRVLAQGGILGIFPEGIRGAFSYYRDAYRIHRFGRDEYVRMALEAGAPIVPFVTVGSAEIFPIFAKLHWRWWKRWSGWPCLPITPTFPLLPLPLPSKWHTRFLEPFHVQELHGPEAASDPAVVRELSREVRRRMKAAQDEMLARRRSVFFGTIFDHPAPSAPREAAERHEEQA